MCRNRGLRFLAKCAPKQEFKPHVSEEDYKAGSTVIVRERY